MKEWNILNHRSFKNMILLDKHKSLSRKAKVIISNFDFKMGNIYGKQMNW
jgi:hypothetical protein